MDEVASIRIYILQKDAQKPFQERRQQADISNTLSVVIGASIGFIGGPGTEGGVVYLSLGK